MTQIPFQGGTFKPIDTPDYVPALQYNYALINRGDDRRIAALRENDRRQTEIAGQQLKALGELSGSLTKFLVEQEKEKQAKQMAEGIMTYEKEGIFESDKESYEQAEKDIKERNIESTKLAKQHEEQGGDFRTSERFRQLSRYQQWGYVRAWVEDQGGKYTLPENINDVQDPAERAELIREHKEKFYEQFADVNPAILNKHLFPQVKQTEKEGERAYQRKTEQLIKQARVDESENFLISGVLATTAENPERATEAVVEFVQQNESLYGGKPQAKQAAVAVLKRLLDNDDIDGETVDLILDTPFKATDGSTQTIRKYWRNQFGGLDNYSQDAAHANVIRDLKDQELAGKENELGFREWVAERIKNGETINEAHLDVWNQKHVDLTGQESEYIKNFKTAEDREDDEDIETLKKLRVNRGYLVEADLDGMSMAVKTTFMPQVQQDAPLAAKNPYEKSAKRRITGYLNQATNLGAGDRNSGLYELALDNATFDYEKLRQENIALAMTPKDAHDKALQDVKEKFLDEDGKFNLSMSQSEYFEEREIPDPKESQQRALDGLSVLNEYTSINDKLNYLNSNLLPNTKELLEQGSKYAVGNGEIPYYYKYLADSIPGLQAWDILDAQLKAAGHEGLGEKHPIDSTLEITGLEDLKRKLGYKVNRSSLEQATVDALDARALVEAEEMGSFNPYTSIFNTDPTFMFEGILTN